MKLVAVSQGVNIFSETNEMRDTLDHRLVMWLLSCGYMTVPVPNYLGVTIRDWLIKLKPAALVLSGGSDIGQCVERDDTELVLISYAKECGLPTLGVCRGMQMMAHHAGVSLKLVSEHVRTRHQVKGEITAEVNSYHNYSLANCPIDFEVIARSEDGEIEAIRHSLMPWEGWMWHPERETVFAQGDIQRLKALFK